MKVSILIVSHLKDKEWLRWCLRSINRFATGFHQTVVVVPRLELDKFRDLTSLDHAIFMPFDQAEPPLGQLHHQVQKCRADFYCPDSDFILHMDADCVWREPVSPSDYFVDEKPVLCVQPYDTLAETGAIQWKVPTERALGFPVNYETMRRHPAVHYRYTYRDVRDQIELVHQIPFHRYVLGCKPDFPQGFSEFNCIGSYVLRNYPNAYHLIDVSKHPYPHSNLVQFWSHGGLDKPQDVWLEGKQEKLVPRNFICSMLK